MTVHEKHLEQEQPKSGEHQAAGSPITKSEDSALKNRQETLNGLKAFRFTKGDHAPFTIDMGNGAKVQDTRHVQLKHVGGDLIPTHIYLKSGTIQQEKIGGGWVTTGNWNDPKYGEQQKHNDNSHTKHDAHKSEPKHESGSAKHDLTGQPLHEQKHAQLQEKTEQIKMLPEQKYDQKQESIKPPQTRDVPVVKANAGDGETAAEAAKHGSLVWHKTADGKYVPERPPGYPLTPPASVGEAAAYAKFCWCEANSGVANLQPQDGDTVDGKKFHR